MEKHIKDMITWHLKNQMGLRHFSSLKCCSLTIFWQACLHSHQSDQVTAQPLTHIVFLLVMWSYSTAVTTCNYAKAVQYRGLHKRRSAGMRPWWRKCNSVEEIRFRLLDPAAKLSPQRYTSVWTIIGSSGSAMILGTEHGWGKNRIIINRVWSFPNRCYP